jgi:hypothetical protein
MTLRNPKGISAAGCGAPAWAGGVRTIRFIVNIVVGVGSALARAQDGAGPRPRLARTAARLLDKTAALKQVFKLQPGSTVDRALPSRNKTGTAIAANSTARFERDACRKM